MHGSIAAQRLGISSHLLSRITGTIYVIQASKEELSKYNLGLNLKFNKRNEEVRNIQKKKFKIIILNIKCTFINRTDNITHSESLFYF